MKISDLKPGQKITFEGNSFTYLGVKKVKWGVGKADKIVLEYENSTEILCLDMCNISKPIEWLNINLV